MARMGVTQLISPSGEGWERSSSCACWVCAQGSVVLARGKEARECAECVLVARSHDGVHAGQACTILPYQTRTSCSVHNIGRSMVNVAVIAS